MADTPFFLPMSQHHENRGLPVNNDTMVDELVRSGTLTCSEAIAAFKAVDRRCFWPPGSGSLAYADMPLRSGFLHLSAPHIYAKALESLMPLRPGMSFLNVGSGTGYFNSIMSELIGELEPNNGIDIWPETVAHAKRCCQQLNKSHIDFTVGNIYQLNIGNTMRYDRIYLGACANSRSKYLYRLLEVGGILIGPFQVGQTQQLRRVVRQTETVFNVQILGSVQFASLIEPNPTEPRPQEVQGETSVPPSETSTPRGPNEDREQSSGLPGVPFSFSLPERPWSPERGWLYPSSFKRAVVMGLHCRPSNHQLPYLPPEIWIKHIFPWCPKSWFEPSRTAMPVIRTAVPPITLPAACKTSDDAADDAEQSDDGASTRAPSSAAASSLQTTPESRPSTSPSLGVSASGMAVDETGGQLEFGDALVEVFGNGQRHTIGAPDDPDDIENEDTPRVMSGLRMLQLLAANARRRRRSRQDRRDDDDDDFEEYVRHRRRANREVETAEPEVVAVEDHSPPVDDDMAISSDEFDAALGDMDTNSTETALL